MGESESDEWITLNRKEEQNNSKLHITPPFWNKQCDNQRVVVAVVVTLANTTADTSTTDTTSTTSYITQKRQEGIDKISLTMSACLE